MIVKTHETGSHYKYLEDILEFLEDTKCIWTLQVLILGSSIQILRIHVD